MSNTIKYAIGDVHGCANEFENLLRAVVDDAKAHGKRAEIWQLGDLIDRGPNLKEVFDLIEDYGVNTIVGNHEARFIAESLAGQPCNSRARAQTHKQFDELTKDEQDHILKLICVESVNSHIYIEDGVLFYLAHSLPKSPSLGKECAAGAMTTSTRSDELTGLEKTLISYWVAHNYADAVEKVVVVHGHLHWKYMDVSEQIETQLGSDVVAVNIDSGCVYGHHLTALRLDNLKPIQVRSSFNYEQ